MLFHVPLPPHLPGTGTWGLPLGPGAGSDFPEAKEEGRLAEQSRAGVPVKEQSVQLNTTREASLVGGESVSMLSAGAGDGRTGQLTTGVQARMPLTIEQTAEPFRL